MIIKNYLIGILFVATLTTTLIIALPLVVMGVVDPDKLLDRCESLFGVTR